MPRPATPRALWRGTHDASRSRSGSVRPRLEVAHVARSVLEALDEPLRNLAVEVRRQLLVALEERHERSGVEAIAPPVGLGDHRCGAIHPAHDLHLAEV